MHLLAGWVLLNTFFSILSVSIYSHEYICLCTYAEYATCASDCSGICRKKHEQYEVHVLIVIKKISKSYFCTSGKPKAFSQKYPFVSHSANTKVESTQNNMFIALLETSYGLGISPNTVSTRLIELGFWSTI